MLKWPLYNKISPVCFNCPLHNQNVPCMLKWPLHYTNMPCQCGYPDGMSPRGRHSISIPTLAWHICFIIPDKPKFGKISMKTTITAGRSSENCGRFAGGHFAGGYDGMANLCKPITAYNFHVRYINKQMQHLCRVASMIASPEGALSPEVKARGWQSSRGGYNHAGNTTEMLHLFYYTEQRHTTQFCDILLPHFLKSGLLLGMLPLLLIKHS